MTAENIFSDSDEHHQVLSCVKLPSEKVRFSYLLQQQCSKVNRTFLLSNLTQPCCGVSAILAPSNNVTTYLLTYLLKQFSPQVLLTHWLFFLEVRKKHKGLFSFPEHSV